MERGIDTFRSSTARWLFGSFAGLASLLACAIGVGLVVIAIRWMQNMASLYEVTDQRLIIKRGIIFKSVDEVELYRIKDIRLDYSLLNQIADIGTITLTSTDRTTINTTFKLRDVPMARDRREGLRSLVERARQRRGVREIDVDQDYAGGEGRWDRLAG